MNSNITLKLALIFATTLTAMPVIADEDFYPVGVIVHAGATSFTGGLSVKKPALTRGVSFLITQKEPMTDDWGGIQGLLMLDVSVATTKTQSNPKFPFKSDSSLLLAEKSLIPVFCAMANSPVQVCAGVGYTGVQAKDAENIQNYSADFRYDLRVGHYLGRGLTGGVEVHTYNITQQVDKKISSFNALSYQAGLGWSW